MVSLMMYFIERDMDDAAREKFRYALENTNIERPKTIKSPTAGKIVPVNPTKRWRAPEGWKPPGWDEEKSFSVAQSFMGFKNNPR